MLRNTDLNLISFYRREKGIEEIFKKESVMEQSWRREKNDKRGMERNGKHNPSALVAPTLCQSVSAMALASTQER